MGKKYYCSKCEQFHYRGNVYNEHKDYQIDPPEEENGKNVSGKNSESSSSKVSTGTLNAPSNSLTPLRNINISGGLFTENILLRLRDTPKQLEIGQIKSFIDEDTNIKRKQFKDKRREIFEWCIEKWDEISPNIDKWSKDELQEKWIIPFFTQFGHDLEPFEMKEVNKDEEYSFGNFTINFQSKNHKDPFFHIVDVKEDFEMKIDSNPNNSSHHKICQQFINFNSEIKWLFLTNGRILRLLTKYYHTYSKGYIEFDLENIFSNRDVKEFEAMFAIVHKSRFITKPGDHKFVIDEFQKEAVKEGVKVGDSLRDNVHNALELLGNELIQQNPRFLDLVMSEGIDLMEYYAELLRIIYRIIFILYAEQREMLPGAGSIYFEEFSLSSLRILAEKPIKAEKNYDLWKKLFLTFKLVGKGNNFLGINSYDGELFDNDNLDLILNNEIKISNDNLLKIIRLLTTTESNNVRQRINFLEIREEEIGAIYESLLDFKPYIDEISQFQLVAGTERKSTGSYYTPKELIDILIRTTLQPLVEDRLKDAKNYGKNFENAILDIKVCDPACGGGTFLLAALDFLGKKFAQIRTNSDSPSEIELRSARRKVLQYCIYGVDMNPLAVELAKISLWLRATVRDKPLNFLDNHIKCGNSLIGFGKKQKIKKIKPKAFKAIKGNKSTGISPEDKREQNNAREIIKNEIKEREKKGKTVMITSYLTTEKTADICSTKFQEIIELPEDDSRKIEEKEEKYEKLRKDARYQLALKEANIWTSTFFWSFEGKGLGEIPRYTTIEQSRKNVKDPELNKLIDRINEIAENNQIFHWYVEFPEVFSSERKGFDCILTNPPWETLQLKEMEFFTGLNNKILKAPNQSERRKLIKDLKNENYKLFQKYKNAWQAIKKMSHFLKKSGLFDLSAQGTINTYALFVERCWRLISPNGYTGIICPTGIIMNYYMQDLFRTFVKNKSILSMFDFENRKKLFEIDSRYRFCLLTLGGKNVSREIIPMTFYTYDSIEIQESLSIVFKATQDLKEKIKELSENHILIPLKQEDFRLFNPNTITCPSFRTIKDYQLLKNVYKNSKIIINKDIESNNVISNPWDIKFYSMFHMSNDSELFFDEKNLKSIKAKKITHGEDEVKWIDCNKNSYLRLYEGRMIWLYDHRLNSINFAEKGKKRKAISTNTNTEEYQNPYYYVEPNYWIKEQEIEKKIPKHYKFKWFLSFRKITGATNERTFISTVIPRTATADSLILMISTVEPKIFSCLVANLNSLVFDYIVRQKLSTNNLNYFIVEQLPIIPPELFSPKLIRIICKKVLELVYTSYDLKYFANDLNYYDIPFKLNQEKRRTLISELDAVFAILYGIDKENLKYIIDSFNVLKRKEKEKYSEFRSKILILKAYDKFIKEKELFK